MDLSLKKNNLGQLITIFFIQASSTTAYAVFYSGLSLYLTQNKSYSQEFSSIITGLFLSLNYSLPLIGGMIANHIISYKKLYVLGSFSSLCGCLLLSTTGKLYLALAMFLMGSLVNVCLNMFLTQLFLPEQKKERRIAFLWNYTGMNLGFMAGYFLTGFSTLSNNYINLFLLMSFLVLISVILAIIFINEPSLKLKVTKSKTMQIFQCILIMCCLIFCINFLFLHAKSIHNFFTLFAILVLGSIIYFSLKNTNKEENNNLKKFILFSCLAIIFWTFYLLTPIAMMQFIEHDVQRTLFGIKLAPQWIVNIDSVIILLFAPVMTFLFNKNNLFFRNSANYFVNSFLFAACSFLFLGLGIVFNLNQSFLSLIYMLLYLISITFGEIFLTPASNALVGELVPERLRGIMTGAFGMTICIGSLFSSALANKFILPYINTYGLTKSNGVHLIHVFFSFSGFLFVLVMILITLNKDMTSSKLNKEIREEFGS